MSEPPTAPTVVPLLTPAQAMAWLGYEDRATFMRMARAAGLPRVRINRRVFRFEKAAVVAWLRRRGHR